MYRLLSKFPDTFLEEKVVLTGWGVFDQSGEMSSNLLYANLTTKSITECKQFEDSSTSTRLNSRKHLCAQSLSNQDACRGDSGGKPLSQMQTVLSTIVFPSFLSSSRNSRKKGSRTLLVNYFREPNKVPVLVSEFGN